MNINWGLTAALTLQASGALLLLVTQLTQKGQRKDDPARMVFTVFEETLSFCLDKTNEEEATAFRRILRRNRLAFFDLVAGYLISALLTNSSGGCCTFFATGFFTILLTWLEYLIAYKCTKVRE